MQESSGIWSLSGNQLTMETKRPEPLDPFKTDIQLKGDSLVVVIAGMGRLRLERVR